MTEWQPIETAPKQYQKKVLLWFPWESGGAIFLGCWYEPDDDKPDGWYDPYDWEMIGTDASHWAALPSPPCSVTAADHT